jgi:hypothetical protein
MMVGLVGIVPLLVLATLAPVVAGIYLAAVLSRRP